VLVVIDANVLISGAISGVGVNSRVVAAILSGEVVPIVSESILAEYLDVLARPKFARYAEFRNRLVPAIELIASSGVFVQPTGVALIAVRDPDDAPLVVAAFDGGADYLVTNDNDLLVLDGEPALNGLRIVSAAVFVGLLA
jgi:hypothetical protein